MNIHGADAPKRNESNVGPPFLARLLREKSCSEPAEGLRDSRDTPYFPAPAPATFSTATFRRNSAAASGRTVLINIPDPNSNPATRVNRGITLTYQ